MEAAREGGPKQVSLNEGDGVLWALDDIPLWFPFVPTSSSRVVEGLRTDHTLSARNRASWPGTLKLPMLPR